MGKDVDKMLIFICIISDYGIYLAVCLKHINQKEEKEQKPMDFYLEKKLKMDKR